MHLNAIAGKSEQAPRQQNSLDLVLTTRHFYPLVSENIGRRRGKMMMSYHNKVCQVGFYPERQ